MLSITITILSIIRTGMVRPPESKRQVTEFLVCLVVTTTTGDNHQKRSKKVQNTVVREILGRKGWSNN